MRGAEEINKTQGLSYAQTVILMVDFFPMI
jgi:hypothetical protein